MYNMRREAPRTLFSLSAEYQREVKAEDYEVIVVDNGSEPPLDPKVFENLPGNFRLVRIDEAPPSPGRAINRGLAEARGDVIGVMVDGARIATPGLLHFARHGAQLFENALVATLNWHLGFDFQGWAIQAGYNRKREDKLLKSIEWQTNGYRLFEIGTPDESSVDGWFQPLAESNALFMRRELWEALDGVDERFDAPGGGLINLDTFSRALALPEAELVILLSEATFHQVHGGTSSNAPPQRQLENWLTWSSQYARIHGRPYELVRAKRPPTYLGNLPRAALARIVRAAIHPSPMHPERALGYNFNKQLWTETTPVKPADETIAELVELADNEFRHERFTAACAVARLIREYAPEESEPQRLLSLVAPWLRPDGPPPPRRPEYHLALAEAYRILDDKEETAKHYRCALAFQPAYTGPHIQYYLGGEESMHLPFAYELMLELKPAIFVQLGLGAGEAYLTFCQSAAEHRTQTKCYGITEPDDQARGLKRTIEREITNHHERYSSFSKLLAATFEEAAARFADGSVELLHLGMVQSYQETKRVFEAWLPKLSRECVVLFHDVVPRENGSGTWKLWNEIARPGASFLFHFGGSLGLWRKRRVSAIDSAWFRRLLAANARERKRIEDYHAMLSSALALWHAGVRPGRGEEAESWPISLSAGKAALITKALSEEGRQTIRFERIENLGRKECRVLHLDARDGPVFLSLFSIKIARARDGAILFQGESAADFEQLKVSRGMLKHQEDGTVLLVAIGADAQATLPAFELPPNESCYLELVLDATRARFDRNTESTGNAAGHENEMRLDVFHPVEEGYRATECQSRYFAPRSWHLLSIDLPAREKRARRPFRIDPASSPAIVEIERITLKRRDAGEILWSAETQKAFDELQIAGTAARLPHAKHFRILSFDGDPQLLLPSFTIGMTDQPLRLEISLLVDSEPASVRESLATLKTQSQKTEPEATTVPYLALSAGGANGDSAGISLQVPIRMDETQTIRFENIESLSPARDRRLRIKPLYHPSRLKISRIVITQDSSGRILYRAESAEQFEEIEVSAGAAKRITDGGLTVDTNRADQQMHLPALDFPQNGTCRLEIEIEPDSAPSIYPPLSESTHANTGEVATDGDPRR
jgi:hypothetical protein